MHFEKRGGKKEQKHNSDAPPQLISAFLLPVCVPHLQAGQHNWVRSGSFQQPRVLEQLSREQPRRLQQLFKYLKLQKLF